MSPVYEKSLFLKNSQQLCLHHRAQFNPGVCGTTTACVCSPTKTHSSTRWHIVQTTHKPCGQYICLDLIQSKTTFRSQTQTFLHPACVLQKQMTHFFSIIIFHSYTHYFKPFSQILSAPPLSKLCLSESAGHYHRSDADPWHWVSPTLSDLWEQWLHSLPPGRPQRSLSATGWEEGLRACTRAFMWTFMKRSTRVRGRSSCV